jgi:hypothetical protein
MSKELYERLNELNAELGDMFTIIGNIFCCKACNKEINNPFKKSTVRSHLGSFSHLNAVKSLNNDCYQQFDERKHLQNDEFEEQNRKLIICRKLNREFGDIFDIINSVFYCKPCNKEINNPFKKSTVKSHLGSISHLNAIKSFEFNQYLSEQLIDENSVNDSSNDPQKLAQLLVKLTKEFGDIFKINNNIFYCKPCDKEINNPFKKSTIKTHLSSIKHMNAMNSFEKFEQLDNENSINSNFNEQKELNLMQNKRSILLKKLNKEFGNIFEIIDNVFICKPCNKEINNPFKKSTVKSHLSSNIHSISMENFQFPEQSNEQNNYSLIDYSSVGKFDHLLHKYVREFGDVLAVFGSNLFCKACNRNVTNPYLKTTVRQHLANKSHIKALENYSPQQEINEENMIIECDVNTNGSEEKFVNELVTENEFIKCDLNSGSSLISILEKIKDKVNEMINQCKCHFDNNIKNEVKSLLEEYDRRKTAFIWNKNSENNDKFKNNQNFVNNKNDIIIKSGFNGNSSDRRTDMKVKRSFIEPKNSLKNKGNEGLKVYDPLLKGENTVSGQRFACLWPGCERKFFAKSQLKVHLCVHTGEKRFKCDYPNCDKAFERRQTLNYHLEKHKYKGFKYEKRFSCEWPQCSKKFAFRFLLNNHIRVYHLKVERFKCDWPKCGLGFVTKLQYDAHVGRSHIGQSLYKCSWPKCGKQFVNKYSHQKHYNYVHLNQRKYLCRFEGCGESFIGKERLDSHTIEVHNGQKPLACDWPGCEFSTVYTQNLNLHQRIHTNERPYKCSWPQCVWSFRQSDHLKAHMLKHTGERPFSCHFVGCEARFQSKHAMKVHFDKTHPK